MSGVKRFMAPGPWITRDLKECVRASDYDALLARCEADERDAARYRWLRDRSTPPDAVYIATDRITQSMVGDSIDAAIDAAMSIDAAMAQEPPR